jgi:Uma2 family endonuclease
MRIEEVRNFCFLHSRSDDENVVGMGGRVMSERPTVWGELPPDGTVLTTSEYLQTAESMRVQELIFGTLRVAESPTVRHQDLLLELAVLMRVFVGQHRLGRVFVAPLDVILDPAKALIVQPDLFYVSKFRQDIITDRIWGAPDLVVEVMSPHPRIGELQDRLEYFAGYGVRECWLLHQLQREFEVLQLTRHGVESRQTYRGIERIRSPVLPHFSVSPAILSCW